MEDKVVTIVEVNGRIGKTTLISIEDNKLGKNITFMGESGEEYHIYSSRPGLGLFDIWTNSLYAIDDIKVGKVLIAKKT